MSNSSNAQLGQIHPGYAAFLLPDALLEERQYQNYSRKVRTNVRKQLSMAVSAIGVMLTALRSKTLGRMMLIVCCVALLTMQVISLWNSFPSSTARQHIAQTETKFFEIEEQLSQITSILTSVVGSLKKMKAEGADYIPNLPRSNSLSIPIGVVSTKKANLRSGPGTDHSPLMAVSEGTRLVVEKMDEMWYRVIAPSGERAWIDASLLKLSEKSVELQ